MVGIFKHLRQCLPVIFLLGPIPLAQSDELPASDGRYLQIVRTYADNVLRYGRDVYGPKHTPLFVDGINVDTHEPPVWPARKDYAKIWRMPDQWILSNLASQQNLFRVLSSLTLLTGDPQYKQAAVDATRYGFDHLQHETGLLFWGGHAAWDAGHEQPVGEATSREVAGKHELKHHYPFYELMWEVDPKATRKYIEAFWANHILRWDILDFNRHGYFEPIPAWIWESQYVGGPVPFTGQGLTFFNAGSDLFYSAAMLTKLSGDPRPLVWGKRLAKRFVDVRHPETGLGADNFSQYKTHRIQKAFEKKFGDRVTEVDDHQSLWQPLLARRHRPDETLRTIGRARPRFSAMGG